MSAMVYSRASGYVDASPGLVCALRCAGQTLRVRVTGPGFRPGLVRVRFANVDDDTPRPSGWPRFGGRAWAVRAGRLQVVD